MRPGLDASLIDLLAELDRNQVRLAVEAGRLRCVAPAGVLTPALLNALRQRRDELIRHVRRAPDAQPVEVPLSSAQQPLWLHHQIDPGNSAYHLPVSVALTGPLHVPALRQAVGEVVRRHAALRTTFPAGVDGPVQRVMPPRATPLPLIDLGGLPEPVRAATLAAVATAHARRPFDLATGVAHRTALVRVAPGEHHLLLTRHHIASDGWSFGLFAAETGAAYTAFTDGRASGLAPLPRQHTDVPRRQRRASPRLLDAARPVRVCRDRLPAAAVEGLARAAGTTPFTVLVTAFGLAVAAVSHRRNVVLGTPVSGRTPRTERLIGCFATTVPLRLRFDAAATFAGTLARTHEAVRDALTNQDADGPEPFEVVFAFQNTPTARLSLPGVTAVAADPVPVAPKYPLTVTVTADDGGYGVLAEFDESVGDAAAAAVLDRFRTVLTRGCRRPEQTCAGLLREPTPPMPCPVAPTGTLGSRFADIARARPDAVAVSYDGGHLSYRALLGSARRLAQALRASGVRPEDRVLVCVDHSPELLVAVVGSVLAGGAYVPVDPEDPPARHESVIVDADAAAVVTTSRMAPAFAWYEGPVVRVDDLPAEPVPLRPGSPDQLAYVIYTSGTTGAPKGVQVTHRNVLAMFDGADQRLRFSPDDVWTLLHSSAFDFSVWEMWGALLHGGRLVIVPRDRARQTDAVRAALTRDRVTVLSATPSAFGALVPGPAALRVVVLGGERCEPSAFRDWFGADGPEIVNMYGITETTVHVTHRSLTAADTTSPVSPIGRPLPGVAVHVVDPFGAPVAPGGRGEIHVGGGGVARGYLGRPGLTADRFRPDDLGGPPGNRLYASGDLAVRLPGDELGHAGRLDRQLKVRGYRIEPAEIEAALVGHPGVAAAAVVTQVRGADTVLVAHVVSDGPDVAGLRRYLADRLPAYLVPVAYGLLDRLPVNRNGKLDRDALPRIDLAAGTGIARPELPRNGTERSLVDLWREVLAVDAVGIHDDFFDLGGDSLALTRLHGRLAAAFGVQPAMRQLYALPDVASQAALLDRLRR